jgi:hypothetical protein
MGANYTSEKQCSTVNGANMRITGKIPHQLRVRWDNAAHWPAIATHPHHKHIGDKDHVAASEATTLEEVLAVIRKELAS